MTKTDLITKACNDITTKLLQTNNLPVIIISLPVVENTVNTLALATGPVAAQFAEQIPIKDQLDLLKQIIQAEETRIRNAN